jgi:dienelactone hydrolase
MKTQMSRFQMNRFVPFALTSWVLLLSLVLTACSSAAPAATAAPTVTSATAPAAAGQASAAFKDLIPAAQAFVGQLAAGDFAGAVSTFDPTMKTAMPEAKLKDTWQQLLGQVGAFKSQSGTTTVEQKGYRIVLVNCQFEKSAIDVQVVYDIQSRIAGLFFKPGQASVPTAQVSSALVGAAKNLVDQMARGDFAAAVAQFDDKMKGVVNEAMLKESWKQIIDSTGAFKAQTGARTGDSQGQPAVYVTCEFEKSTLEMQVVFNAQGKVTGMHFVSPLDAAADQPYTPPDYVRKEAFKESDVTVGSGEWALPATLSMPVGSGPFAAVVLVHGSGPNDRDETIGPNKPFRDLAWGLASQGVAVLRYDKRTKARAAQFTPDVIAKLTLKEETTDDALLAVQLLRQTQGIDPKRIYVLGHSLGATAAPRIGQQDPALAGLIVMAGMAIPMEDEVLRQYQYLYTLQGAMTDQQKSEIEALKLKVAKVKDPNLSAQVPASELPLNIAAAYWLDLRGYQPAEVAKSLAMRLLVLQGERDYQVSPDQDFSLWKAAMAGKPNATLKLYPKLNHLFIAGEGQPNPQEYGTVGHVSPEVIADIARWINQ